MIAFAESVLGDAALRLGRYDEARAAFLRSLDLVPGDAYALGALADALLDTGRPEQVMGLLQGHEQVDGLLLRLALAATAARSPRAAEYREELDLRIDQSRRRGDRAHLREEARYELRLRGDAKRALELARKDFEMQREPWDVRLLLESALAAHDPKSAQPALDFLRETHLEDPRIAALSIRAAEIGP